ncbi:TIGR03089 family protein [Actinorugispora endophytica]|uniref:Uncharacterized protein (TIGR03089 family) n=1 Tax=Actinorugispora endophytica TaxID=1605990 RepID=A0A4R6V015_9ACTN|nr:TIGR03089 family protein [Actinorugispora endophytica]TDQ51926.1 uncharacterized protein (TIGR03089 family) [Actinorugispora endophytica]
MSVRTPVQLWQEARAVDAARPFVTAYDEATGGRVELSFATFDNWVSKTANMLVDGLGAEPGERVVLALPVHWQSLVWAIACWSAGLTAVLAGPGDLPEGDIAVADAARLEAALDSGAREAVGTSLHPLGLPLADRPPAALDYSVEVRGYGDHFRPDPVDPAAAALVNGDDSFTGAELAAAGARTARTWKLTASDRVAIITSESAPLALLGRDLSRFLGVLSSSAAMVLVPGLDSVTLQSRLGMERVTAITGAPSDSLSSETPLKSLP